MMLPPGVGLEGEVCCMAGAECLIARKTDRTFVFKVCVKDGAEMAESGAWVPTMPALAKKMSRRL